jgi:hypothetical protein
MEAQQFFTTTIVHKQDHNLRWHFVAAPKVLIADLDPFESSAEVVLTRSSVPFVMASMILAGELEDQFDSEGLVAEVETRFNVLKRAGLPERDRRALELAESVIFDSQIAFEPYRMIQPLSLINPEYSKVALTNLGGRRVLVIQGPRGFLLGVAGPISTIHKIWEKLIDLM